jgi:hypothetical protein
LEEAAQQRAATAVAGVDDGTSRHRGSARATLVRLSQGTVVALSSCSDASDTGYGAASYFHAPGYETAFVAAKGKVIGKRLSTPRSELQALVVSCRLAKTILKETEDAVNVGKIVFWVDSTAVYFWVKNNKDRYVPFVANRLAEIHDVLDKLKQYQPEVCTSTRKKIRPTC